MATGAPARIFAEFDYQTVSGTWSRARRVVGKAEVLLGGKENPRFVVISLRGKRWNKRALYEDLYCARGERENQIKEQLSLFASRVSSETMRANQVRLHLSGMPDVLVSALRRIGLAGTEMARAQAETIRLRLLKIGARDTGAAGAELPIAGAVLAGGAATEVIGAGGNGIAPKQPGGSGRSYVETVLGNGFCRLAAVPQSAWRKRAALFAAAKNRRNPRWHRPQNGPNKVGL